MAYDLIVIGGGPAGYVAAIRAAQLGKKVACVEAERAGGTCLNWGCIPTKALLKNAELFHTLSHRAAEFGFSFDNLQYDWSAVIGRSRKVADRLAGGIEFLFKKNKVDYVRGHGAIVAPGKVEVTAADGSKQTAEAKHIIIATGAKSRPLPPLPFNGTTVISSREAMILPTAAEEHDHHRRRRDRRRVRLHLQRLRHQGDRRRNGCRGWCRSRTTRSATRWRNPSSSRASAALPTTRSPRPKTRAATSKSPSKGPKENGVLSADVVLVAIGVMPVLPGGLQPELTERGFVKTGDRYETSIPGVYAIGDVSGPPLLAHTASFEAIQCVEGLYVEGHKVRKVTNFPGCTYCHPQVASVGKTERQLKDEGVEYTVGKIPFVAIGKAIAAGEPDGFAKLLYGKQHGELLGAHIIGDNATELIAEMGLALDQELTAEEIHATIHAHPTMSEVIHEATLAAEGHAIHF